MISRTQTLAVVTFIAGAGLCHTIFASASGTVPGVEPTVWIQKPALPAALRDHLRHSSVSHDDGIGTYTEDLSAYHAPGNRLAPRLEARSPSARPRPASRAQTTPRWPTGFWFRDPAYNETDKLGAYEENLSQYHVSARIPATETGSVSAATRRIAAPPIGVRSRSPRPQAVSRAQTTTRWPTGFWFREPAYNVTDKLGAYDEDLSQYHVPARIPATISRSASVATRHIDSAPSAGVNRVALRQMFHQAKFNHLDGLAAYQDDPGWRTETTGWTIEDSLAEANAGPHAALDAGRDETPTR